MALPESPSLPRSCVARERQRNALDGFPSLKFRDPHSLAPNFVPETSQNKRLSFPSTFHQVMPSNGTTDRHSGSSYGYVPFQPAHSNVYERAPQLDESNPVYCNLPFQQNIAPFVPLTRQNMAPSVSFDSLDSSRPDTFSSLSHTQQSPIHTDTFHPVKFISREDVAHTSLRSLATPASTRLFLSTPVDTSMLSLSASQDCIYDSNRNTQKKCIRMLSASMNLNPEAATWVIPPSTRAKRKSLASAGGHSSLADSVESMDFDSGAKVAQYAPHVAATKDRGITRLLSGLFGLLKFPSRKRSNQSKARSGKRKDRGRVIGHPTISHTSGNVSRPFMSLPPPAGGRVPHSSTPYRSNSPLLSLQLVPNGTSPNRRQSSRTQFGAGATQLQRKISLNSDTSSSINRPTHLPLSQETAGSLYENLPIKSRVSRAKPPIPQPSPIYSNSARDTSPPYASRTPDPSGPHHICDTRTRTDESENPIGYSETVPYAGLRKAVTEVSNTKRERNVKYVGSTPSMNIPTLDGKATDHSTGIQSGSNNTEVLSPLTGPTSRRAAFTRPALIPKPAKFSSVETLC